MPDSFFIHQTYPKLKDNIINAGSSEDIEKLLTNWETQQMEEEL